MTTFVLIPAAAQTITVTDPPVSQGDTPATGTAGHFNVTPFADVSNLATLAYSGDNAAGALIAGDGSYAASAALLRQYLASSFVTTSRPWQDADQRSVAHPATMLTLPHVGTAA